MSSTHNQSTWNKSPNTWTGRDASRIESSSIKRERHQPHHQQQQHVEDDRITGNFGSSAYRPTSSSSSSSSSRYVGIPRRPSYSTELATWSSLKRVPSLSPPVALPPLRSIVPYGGGADKRSESMRDQTFSQQHHRNLSSASTPLQSPISPEPAGSSKWNMNPQQALLEKIHSTSMALTQHAQQNIGSPLTVEVLEEMQHLSTEVNSHVQDLYEQYGTYQRPQSRVFEPPTSSSNRKKGSENARRNSTPTHLLRQADEEASFRGKAAIVSPTEPSPSQYGPLMQFRYPQDASSSHVQGRPRHSSDAYHYNHYLQPRDMTAATSQRSPTSTDGGTSSLAEVLARPSKYRKRSRAAAPQNCLSCGAEDTPEWRRGPGGVRTLCNACGLHYSKMLRKKKMEVQKAEEAIVTIEELRASLFVPKQAGTSSEKRIE